MPKLLDDSNRKNNHVQSILVSNSYAFSDLRNLIKLLGYNYNKPDVTKNYYRIRQFNPTDGKKYRIIESKLAEGIKYVIEY